MQTDFFTRFPKRKETMNRYWVGRKESERVLGVDPSRGPLAQLMTWVRNWAKEHREETEEEKTRVIAIPIRKQRETGGGRTVSAASSPSNSLPYQGTSPFPSSPSLLFSSHTMPNFQCHSDEDDIGMESAPYDVRDDAEHVRRHGQRRARNHSHLDGDEKGDGNGNDAAAEDGNVAAVLRRESNTNTNTEEDETEMEMEVDMECKIERVCIRKEGKSASGESTLKLQTHSVQNFLSPNVTLSPSYMLSPASTPSPLALKTATNAAATLAAKQQQVPSSIPPHAASASPASTSAIPASAPTSSTAQTVTSPSTPSLPPAHPSLYVIHLRTCIDKSDASSASSIERFGEYCLQGTEGVRLCNRMDENTELHPNECIIDTQRDLNWQTHRKLIRKLQDIRSFEHRKQQQRRWVEAAMKAAHTASGAASSPSPHSSTPASQSSPSRSFTVSIPPTPRPPLKIAVIGGWTDEDVYHICYELRRRFHGTELATCSILTASPSSSQHWNTLAQLKRVIGVSVTRTIKELIEWFGIGAVPYRLPGIPSLPPRAWPSFEWVGGESRIPKNFKLELDGELLAHLYRSSRHLVIDTLVGGFSPSIVLSVQSFDRMSVREAASVVKLASRGEIATELQAFQRVEEMLGNNAPSVRAFVELGDRGGIKFRYTHMSGGKVRRLLDLCEAAVKGEAVQPVLKVIDEIYGEIFGGWYAAAHTEMFDLFSYYFDGYAMSHGDPVSMVHQEPTYLKQFISYALAKKGSEPAPHFKNDLDFYGYPPYDRETFQFPQCAPLTNLGLLFEKPSGMPYLRTLPPRRLYSTFAHGDANLQNFLIDDRNNVWVIDFFFTEPRNHVLRDLSKTWSCVMYIGAEITSDAQFAQAFLISEELAYARDLHTPLPTHIHGLTDMQLKSIYQILQRLWSHVGRMVKDRSSAVQFQLALVADAMRFFLYTTRNMYSKRWALATAVLLSESVLIQEKRIHDVTPSWLPMEQIPMAKGALGMTRSPGNRNFMRFERSPIMAQEMQAVGRAAGPTPMPGQAASASSPSSSPSSTLFPPPSSCAPSGSGSGSSPFFRRELSQAERQQKEAAERVRVQAAHARARESHAGGAGQVEQRIASEHARLMHEQDEEKQRYAKEQGRKAELLAARNASGSFGLAYPMQLKDRTPADKQKLLADEDEDADDDNDEEKDATPELDAKEHTHTNQPSPVPSSVQHRSSPTAQHVGVTGRAVPISAPSYVAPPQSPTTPNNSGTIPCGGGGAISITAASPSPSPSAAASTISAVPSAATTVSHVNDSHLDMVQQQPVKKLPRVQKECLKLKEEGVTHLMLLVTDAEFKEMGVDKAKLLAYLSECGIEVVSVSLPPGIMQVPLIIDLVKISLGILCDERRFKLLVVSKGGFHRAGTLAACILCSFGIPPEQSIRLVRECRGAQAIGRDSREKTISKFDLAWKNLLIGHIVQTGAIREKRNRLVTASAGQHQHRQLHQDDQKQQPPQDRRESSSTSVDTFNTPSPSPSSSPQPSTGTSFNTTVYNFM